MELEGRSLYELLGSSRLTKSVIERGGVSPKLGSDSQRTTAEKNRKCNDVFLSIVIPAYNEHNRLPKTIVETVTWCNSQHDSEWEILIIDDGSSDDMLEIYRRLELLDRRVRVLLCPHLGKGAAVRMGILNARGLYVLFVDADGATPLTEIPKLISELDAGHHIAIGSRAAPATEAVQVDTSVHRKIIGRMFAFFVNTIAVKGIGDTQCGFKMFKSDVVRKIFAAQHLDGFAFDVEILFLARRASLSIVEVPVNWNAQKGSKVNLIADSLKMLRDIIRIRWLHRRAT